MVSTYGELISEQRFIWVSALMIILASIFVLARIGIQIWRRKKMYLQDCLVYCAYIFFLTMSICYLIIVPNIYRIGRVTVGRIEPWPAFAEDVIVYVRLMFVTTSLFWLSLWFVKLSLLALYKNLMDGLPMMYIRLWWALFVFCLISLVGCIVSYLTSCPDFAASLSKGECSGPRSVRGQLASLYTSYALDVLSNLMIMALPIKLVWGLQMARGQKIAVIALFGSGVICVAFATLRVIQIGIKTGNNTSPSPTWLALWTIVECAVAVCIGCCPAFAGFYHATRTKNTSRDMHGYLRHDRTEPSSTRSQTGAVNLTSIKKGFDRARSTRRESLWRDHASSQEELALDTKGILVTTTLQQVTSSELSREHPRPSS
ncbi:hypothetical protein IQ06DRAFT_313933 [Phaeosphaeriaceae sp. SRC1lsM3a]|nr:hypothetical protein IQ06DRAFT_313933 [Stagonospora sp. SRC1lsM3a]